MSNYDNNSDSSAPRSSSRRPNGSASTTTRRSHTSETVSSARFPGMPQRRGFDDNSSLDGSPQGPRFVEYVSNVSGTQDFSNGAFGTLKNLPQESGAADNFLKQITNDGKEALGLSKLDRAKNYAGYTKNGYQSYRDKGFKQYTGDVVKHTSKETVKETSKYAVVGGLTGAVAGGISGLAAGGVGAIPGAMSGAKLGATQGAKFGAKKGAKQAALDASTGAADEKLNQDRDNKERKRAEKADKKRGAKSVPAAAVSGNSLEGGNKSFDLDNRADFDTGSNKNSRGDQNIHNHSLAAANIPRRETPSERARRMKERAGESVQGSFASMKNLKGKGSGAVNQKTVAAAGVGGAAIGMAGIMFMTMMGAITSSESSGTTSGSSYSDPCSPSLAVNAVNKVNDVIDYVTGRDDEGDTDGGDGTAMGESSEMDTASDIGTIDNNSQMTVDSGVWHGKKANVIRASLQDDVKKILDNPNEYGLSAERGPYANESREDRIDNVVKIIGVAKGYASNDEDAKKLAMYGVIVSSAETGWENPQGGDRDSVGPFQQRTSIYGKDGVNDVVKSAEMFYKGKSGIPGMMSESSWKTASTPGDIAQAAQNVQRSAFPDGSNYRAKYDVSKKMLDTLFKNATKEGSGTGNETDGKGGLPDITVNDKCGNSATLDLSGKSGSGSGGWTNPANGPLTSGFGKRSLAAADAENGGHLGQDIGAACGAPIWSASDGKVKDVAKDNSGGNIILIHNDEANVDFMYVHMRDGGNKVKIGDNVKAGQQISEVGQTGQASGCHLHFQISDPPTEQWFDQSKAVDPGPWMKKKGINLGSDPHSKVVGRKEGKGGTKNVKNDNAECKTDDKTLQKGLDQACQYLDRPYSWGGGGLDGPTNGINDPGAGLDATNKNGFDCSSYVRFIIYQATDKKVEIPRTAQAQYEASSDKAISKDDMKPGDLMFYGTPSNLHHVTMYIGNDKMIEAANPTDGLRIRGVDTGGDFYAATRPHDFG